MNFLSWQFVGFYAITYLFFWATPGNEAKKWMLIAASYFFYGAWDWRFNGLMLGVTLNAFAAGWALKRSRARGAAPWIGAAAGFGVGFAGGWAAGDPPSCQWLCFAPKPATGAVIGVIGAGLGALVGHFAAGKAEILVYRSR